MTEERLKEIEDYANRAHLHELQKASYELITEVKRLRSEVKDMDAAWDADLYKVDVLLAKQSELKKLLKRAQDVNEASSLKDLYAASWLTTLKD